jgi:hypothetical protein
MREIGLNLKRSWTWPDHDDDSDDDSHDGPDKPPFRYIASVAGSAACYVISQLGRHLSRSLHGPTAASSKFLDLSRWGGQWNLPPDFVPDTPWTALLTLEAKIRDSPECQSLRPAADDAEMLEQWLEAADAAAHVLQLLAELMIGVMNLKDGRCHVTHQLSRALT